MGTFALLMYMSDFRLRVPSFFDYRKLGVESLRRTGHLYDYGDGYKVEVVGPRVGCSQQDAFDSQRRRSAGRASRRRRFVARAAGEAA